MARYIDAEKLLIKLQQRYESALCWYENVSEPNLKTRAKQAVASFLESIFTIQNQPTADVQEVKHAHWIDRNIGWGGVICSYCKWEDKVLIGDNYHYCPNCGAKMDGKENE